MNAAETERLLLEAQQYTKNKKRDETLVDKLYDINDVKRNLMVRREKIENEANKSILYFEKQREDYVKKMEAEIEVEHQKYLAKVSKIKESYTAKLATNKGMIDTLHLNKKNELEAIDARLKRKEEVLARKAQNVKTEKFKQEINEKIVPVENVVIVPPPSVPVAAATKIQPKQVKHTAPTRTVEQIMEDERKAAKELWALEQKMRRKQDAKILMESDLIPLEKKICELQKEIDDERASGDAQGILESLLDDMKYYDEEKATILKSYNDMIAKIDMEE